MAEKSGETDGILILANALKNAFKQMTRKRRTASWNAISSSKGKEEVDNLIRNPDRPLSRFRLIKSFKEWLQIN